MKIFRNIKGIIALGISIAILGGCGSVNNTSLTSASAPSNTTSLTQEAKSDWPEKITIVQMPDESNPDAGSLNEGFRTAFEEYVGIKVEELKGSEYAVGIEAMKNGKLEVLLVSPMSYYQAKKMANVEPLVTTASMGTEPYKTVFITKSDRDDINAIEDLKGKTFAFVDPASSSGYMYPKAKLVTELKLDAEQLENPKYFFETVTYSGKHDSSIMGVAMGDYDGAAVALQIIQTVIDAGLIKEGDLKIIGETDVIPNACYVIRTDLPQDLKDKIKEFYLQYNDETFFETFYQSPSIRFIEAKDSDYDVVSEMVEILKIEE